ncbi:MAG: YwiC-like family protein [Candidatus Omnitrophica bacterium]|nr:YwiC-like family protein [Candidatus Omnitrophota bacterium]
MPAVDVTTLKIVAVPAEHGASVMLGESLLAGLLIAASALGFYPALGWVFLFLMSHPLKIVIKDMSHRVFVARTSLALGCSGIFGLLSLVFFTTTYVLSGPAFLLVLVGVIPLGLLHVWAVVKAGKKELLAEISGAVSLGAAGASIILAAGHPYSQAWVVWAVLAVRALTSIIYVRERLNQSRSRDNHWILFMGSHMVAVVVFVFLVMAHLVHPFILIAGLLLLMRLGLIYKRIPVTAKGLGIQESILGIVFVLCVVFAF